MPERPAPLCAESEHTEEIARLSRALGILSNAHEEIVRGDGLPEDISRDAILRAAAVLNRVA